jgi:hypothetical protein
LRRPHLAVVAATGCWILARMLEPPALSASRVSVRHPAVCCTATSIA